MSITLTDSLIKRIKNLRAEKESPNLNLRVLVDGGGCQGFEYRFELTETQNKDDHVFEKDGVSVLVDEISLPYLTDSEIDFTDELIGASFKINNPNAASSCGCGTSFSVKGNA